MACGAALNSGAVTGWWVCQTDRFIPDPGQVQSVRRGRGACGTAVTCSKGMGHPFWLPCAGANFFERADHIADLMVQKRPRLGNNMHLIPHTCNVQLVQRANGAVGLTGYGAERCKVMLSKQACGRLLHAQHVQRRFDVPDMALGQSRPCAPVENAVAVRAPCGGKPRTPVQTDWCGIQHHDSVGFKVVAQSLTHGVAGKADIRGEVQMGDLCQSMHARIRAPRCNAGYRPATGKAKRRFFQQSLHGQA